MKYRLAWKVQKVLNVEVSIWEALILLATEGKPTAEKQAGISDTLKDLVLWAREEI